MNSLAPSRALDAEIKAFCAASHLTPRETEIFAILVEGVVRIKDVAERLKLSPNTVNNHVNSIFMKTRTRSKSQLLAGFLNHVAEDLERARFFKQSPKVLILEREIYASTHLADSLEKQGFRVTVVASQVELDAKIRSVCPNFLVLDPALLSEPVSTFMRKTCETLHPAPLVLFAGAGGDVTTRARAMHLGAIDLLPKPVDPSVLYQTMMCHYIEDEKDRARFLESIVQDKRAASEDFTLTRENLGTGGVLLSSQDLARILKGPVTIGDHLDLKLRLGTEPLSTAQGQVVWMNADNAGVRFMNLTRRDRDRLSTFLRENAIQSYIPARD